jgi:hypothetical protein
MTICRTLPKGLAASAVAMACAIGLATTAMADDPPASNLADGTKVLIPFDFTSKFDDGRYGQIVGDLVWGKIRREKGFILPESMQDVRDAAERRGFTPDADTPLDKLANIVKEEQGAQVAVWGQVERVEGQAEDVYDVWVKVGDFTGPKPRMVFERQGRTTTVSEIPHVYIQSALEALYGRKGVQIAPGVIDDSPEGAATGPNLVRGDFETSGPSGPNGWDPVTPLVSVVKGGDDGHVLRFSIPLDVAESSGVLYYSDFFPVDEGAVYEFRCRYRTDKPSVKVFIKGYDEMTGAFKGKAAGASGVQKREVYRSQQNLPSEPGSEWRTHVETFTPHHSRFHPRWARVMLYAYLHAGTVEWDDVSVRLVKPAPAK